jgi:hypothetical protein
MVLSSPYDVCVAVKGDGKSIKISVGTKNKERI